MRVLASILIVLLTIGTGVAAPEQGSSAHSTAAEFLVTNDINAVDKLIKLNLSEAREALTHARLAPLRARLGRLQGERAESQAAVVGLEDYVRSRRTLFLEMYSAAKTTIEQQSLASAFEEDRQIAEARLEAAREDLTGLMTEIAHVELALRLGSIPKNPVPAYDSRRARPTAVATVERPTISPEEARRIFEEAARQVEINVTEDR